MSLINNPISRKEDIVIQELKGELLIYDLKINKAFCLNETSALVWQACDGTKSVSEISHTISKKLKSPASEDLIWLALDDLKKENLLDNTQQISNKFGSLSRREVIRKVGLASLIALPLISSLTAPTAAMAQSLGTTCSSGADSCLTNDDCAFSLNGPFCNTFNCCDTPIAAGPCVPTPDNPCPPDECDPVFGCA